MRPELSFDAVQEIVIVSSVTATTRTFVGVVGGVRSRAACAAGATTAGYGEHGTAGEADPHLTSPGADFVRSTRGYRRRFWRVSPLACER